MEAFFMVNTAAWPTGSNDTDPGVRGTGLRPSVMAGAQTAASAKPTDQASSQEKGTKAWRETWDWQRATDAVMENKADGLSRTT